MKKLNLDTAESFAIKTKNKLGIGINEPVNMKTVIRQLNIMAIYRPLSNELFGLSLKSHDRRNMFMLINSNSTRGRQHFTIAHELFHLLYDEKPEPHFSNKETFTDSTERSANLFASAFLMPREGIIRYIPNEELASGNVSIDTALRIGQLYGVSHGTLVIRLRELKVINKQVAEKLQSVSVTYEAHMRGYNRDLYMSGNEGLIIGDFGAMARELYDKEKISEGHYMELINMINNDENEDSSGC